MASREPFGTKAAMAYTEVTSQRLKDAAQSMEHLDGRLPHCSHLVLHSNQLRRYESVRSRPCKVRFQRCRLKEPLRSRERLRAVLGESKIESKNKKAKQKSYGAEIKRHLDLARYRCCSGGHGVNGSAPDLSSSASAFEQRELARMPSSSYQ